MYSFRYWRSVSLDTESESWPHWGTDYTKTPRKNLRGPSPSGWVLVSRQKWLYQPLNGIIMNSSDRRRKSLLHGHIFHWGSLSLPTAAVSPQVISRSDTKWPTHCSFFPASLSWILITSTMLDGVFDIDFCSRDEPECIDSGLFSPHLKLKKKLKKVIGVKNKSNKQMFISAW